MWGEARLAKRRENARIASEAVVMHAVISSIIGGGENLNKVLGRLTDGDE
jgi:hypothetical protein